MLAHTNTRFPAFFVDYSLLQTSFTKQGLMSNFVQSGFAAHSGDIYHYIWINESSISILCCNQMHGFCFLYIQTTSKLKWIKG